MTTPPDGPPLPEMREALLSNDDVKMLAADLEAHTQVHAVFCKGARQTQTGPSDALPLAEAIERLLARTVLAIQVRYAFESREWTDTLMAMPGGFRLVRCQHQEPPN